MVHDGSCELSRATSGIVSRCITHHVMLPPMSTPGSSAPMSGGVPGRADSQAESCDESIDAQLNQILSILLISLFDACKTHINIAL